MTIHLKFIFFRKLINGRAALSLSNFQNRICRDESFPDYTLSHCLNSLKLMFWPQVCRSKSHAMRDRRHAATLWSCWQTIQTEAEPNTLSTSTILLPKITLWFPWHVAIKSYLSLLSQGATRLQTPSRAALASSLGDTASQQNGHSHSLKWVRSSPNLLTPLGSKGKGTAHRPSGGCPAVTEDSSTFLWRSLHAKTPTLHRPGGSRSRDSMAPRSDRNGTKHHATL